MNAGEVREALRKRYSDTRRYACAEEVGLTTGSPHRRLDMIVLDCYFSNGFRIDGIEIKVSTSDLRRELEDPEKHIAFFDVIDYYTLAAPAGVVEPLLDIIPKKWGIMIVNKYGTTRFKRKPLAIEDKKADRAVPRGFFASVTRAIQSHQPSAEELQRAYERGAQEEKKRQERDLRFTQERLSREGDKLKAYDELARRFRLYGNDVSKAMDEFEAFRKLDIQWLRSDIKRMVVQLEKLECLLGGQEKEETE